MCLSLGATVATFRGGDCLSGTSLRLFHACLIVEAAWVYLVDALDVQVLYIVGCANDLAAIVLFAALVGEYVLIHQEVNGLVN